MCQNGSQATVDAVQVTRGQPNLISSVRFMPNLTFVIIFTSEVALHLAEMFLFMGMPMKFVDKKKNGTCDLEENHSIGVKPFFFSFLLQL